MEKIFAELAQQLQRNHKYVNGCWFTDYAKIHGLKLKASTINGTSGLGRYKGRRVYWTTTHGIQGEKFTVTLDK